VAEALLRALFAALWQVEGRRHRSWTAGSLPPIRRCRGPSRS